MVTQTRRKKPAPEPATGDHLLAHLVPDMVFAEEYISRTIKNVRDIDLLRYAKEARNNVMLYGPTGPGKTSCILAYAATDGLPLVTVQANGAVDPNSLFGGWQPDPDDPEGRRLVWVDSEVTQVIRHGGILYIDEANFMPPKMMAVFHGLDKRRQITILDRGNEVVKAHPDLQVICAFNPDYEGTRPLNAAFKNRFKIKVRFDYDPEVESQLVYLPVMLDVAKKLRASNKAGDLETPVSTNMLIEFEELAVDLGYDFAVENFLNAFHDDERSAVKDVLELNSATIKEQLAEMERLANEATA